MLTFLDYTVFVFVLLISLLIGIYFGCFGTKQSSTNEYLLGKKKMNFIPVGISVAVSHFSGVAIIGVPADVFKYGAGFILTSISLILMALLSIYIYLPVLFELQLTSIYEYFERRFDIHTKRLALYLYILQQILFFSLVTYAPSLVFSTATGLNVNLVAFVTSIFCIIYTSIGGLKTVVWTDLFQFVVILACIIFLLVSGIKTIGGFGKIWDIALEGGRLDVFDFRFDPTIRENFWCFFFGLSLALIAAITVHQTGAQKFSSVPKFSDCVKSVIYTCISYGFVSISLVMMGIVIYSKYSNCDPLTSKKIKKHDQMLPYFIEDVAGHIPGIQGLFVSTIFCAALSTMSSILNSLSGVLYEEFIKTYFKKEYSESIKSNILKVIVVVSGLVCTCLVFLIEHLGEVFALAFAFTSVSNGPVLGMFTLGMLFPMVHKKGAFYGGLIGHILSLLLIMTSKYYFIHNRVTYPPKPVSTDGCDFLNQTSNLYSTYHTVASFKQTNMMQLPFLFRISFHYYTLIGTVLTIIFGIIISCLLERKSPADKIFLSPFSKSWGRTDGTRVRAESTPETEESNLHLLANKNESSKQ